MDQFITYLDETVEKLKLEEDELRTAGREDEATFIKIKVNICEISKSVYQVVAKQSDADSLKDSYTAKMENISGSWVKAYEKAKEHQDINRIMVEEIKLEMHEQIKRKLLELV